MAIVDAIQALTDAVYLSRGLDGPFAIAPENLAASRPVGVALAEARAKALAIASADWMHTSARLAEFVDSLADIASSTGLDAGREQGVAELRYQAQRLRRVPE